MHMYYNMNCISCYVYILAAVYSYSLTVYMPIQHMYRSAHTRPASLY